MKRNVGMCVCVYDLYRSPVCPLAMCVVYDVLVQFAGYSNVCLFDL